MINQDLIQGKEVNTNVYTRHAQKLIGLLNKADGVEKFENAIIKVIPKLLAQLAE